MMGDRDSTHVLARRLPSAGTDIYFLHKYIDGRFGRNLASP